MSSDYILEFRSIDPARRYPMCNNKQQFIHGFNKNGITDEDVRKEFSQEDLSYLESDFDGNNKLKFIIKPYQRGFRWDADNNVEKLLDDLFAYSEKNNDLFNKTRINYKRGFEKDEFDFYCLQTLTVKRAPGEGCWEVIDGQQRLTCMLLIYDVLSYFCDSPYTPYEIEYQREREDGNITLADKLKGYFDELDKATEGETEARRILKNDSDTAKYKKDWFRKRRTDIKKLFEQDPDFHGSYIIDSYYIQSALLQIFDFVSKGKDQEQISTLLNCVKRNVYFLWYVVPDDDNELRSEDVFLKINSGAIPLTNAELIKSLVLRSTSEKDESDEKNSKENKSDVKNRSRKWETIEQGLSVDELWSFIAGDYNPDTRIDLLLDVYARKLDDSYKGNSENNPYALFDWYSKYREKKFYNDQADFANAVLNGIQDIFDRVLEWFDDVEIYHYIGLLTVYQTLGFKFSSYNNQQEMLKVLIIEAENETTSKKDLVKRLKDHVVNCLKSGLTKENTKNKNQPPDHVWQLVKDSDAYNNDFMNYEEDKKRVEAILWLFNVYETIESTDNKTEVGYKSNICRRFPFSEALSKRWSLEHIFPQHPDENDTEAMDLYKKETEGLSEDKRIKEDDVHFIRNLALLDNKTNTALQNEMLSKKRRKLIEKIGEGKFVPCSTINAFMLYYNISASNGNDDEGSPYMDWNYWTCVDADRYEQKIVKCLEAMEGVTK